MAAGLALAPARADTVTLKMAVPDWPPTHIMKDLFDKNYKPKSGNTVKLDVDFIPWPDYYTRLNASLTSGEKKYNMAVSDSQWLGAFIEGGYYLNINKYVDADPGLQAVFKDLHPAVKASYSTYPYKSDKLYGFPQMPDLVVNYYRKDVFCDETEQKNFKAKYNYKLPCAPEEMDKITWDNYRDIGEFFKRKKGEMLMGKPLDDDFFGVEFQVGKGYDFFTTSVYEFLWQARRRHLGRDQAAQRPCARRGELATSAVKSFEHLLSFIKYMPPEGPTGNLDIFKTDELFRAGKVASNLEWIGFAESSIHADTSKVADKVAFAQLPGTEDRQGRRALVRDRRPAVRADDLEHRLAEQGGARLLQVVAVEGRADRVRQGRRPERAEVGLHRPELCDASAPGTAPGRKASIGRRTSGTSRSSSRLLTEQQEEYTKAVSGQETREGGVG